MPEFMFHSAALLITHRSVLVDTNVLVAAFREEEEHNYEADFFLNERSDLEILIPVCVVVETWGFLVGARGNWRSGYNLLAWLNTPGRATVISQKGDLSVEQQVVISLGRRIDCVDAMISRIAHDISVECALRKSIPIATYDTSDYYLINQRHNFDLRVFDMRDVTQSLDDL